VPILDAVTLLRGTRAGSGPDGDGTATLEPPAPYAGPTTAVTRSLRPNEEPGWERVEDYVRLVSRARADDRVVGLVLVGAPGRSATVPPDRCWDVRLVVRDDAVIACSRVYETQPDAAVRTRTVGLKDFSTERRTRPLASPDRYEDARADVVVDKLDGEIAGLVAVGGSLDDDQARRVAQRALVAYLDACRRSSECVQTGDTTLSQLETAESIPHVVTAVFALHRRVRPPARYLRWELETHPFEGDEWEADRFLTSLRVVASTGAVFEQRNVLCDVEELARLNGLGHVFDEREHDLAWLRAAGRSTMRLV